MSRLEPDDQAAGLRRLLGEQNSFRALAILGPDPGLNASASIAIAFALAQRGVSVCLLDEAPAPDNATARLGLAPHGGLADVALRGQPLDEVLLTLPDGPRVLPAERALEAVADADQRLWSRHADDFAAAGDWLLLAGPADERASLALAAPRRLLVLPAAKARLTEAYAVCKAAQHQQPDAQWQALVMGCDDAERGEQLLAALADTCARFMGVEVSSLGSVPRDPGLEAGQRALRPLLNLAPTGAATAALRQIAARLSDTRPVSGLDAKVFWQRLGLFSRLNRPPRQPTRRHPQHGRAYG